MTKLYIILTLLSASFQLEAQDGYVKYNIDSKYKTNALKIFKDEILPYFNSTEANKINVLIGNDTISNLPLPSKNYQVVPLPNTAYQSQKESLVQLKKGGMVYINATTIDTKDTVTLISQSGQKLIQLVTQRDASVKQSDCGKTFRLIITNAPSIFYDSDKLTQFVESEQPQGTDATPPNKNLKQVWHGGIMQ